MSNVFDFNLNDAGSPEDAKELMGISAALYATWALELNARGFSKEDIFKIMEGVFNISVDQAMWASTPFIISHTYMLSDHTPDGFISVFKEMEKLGRERANRDN
jgi:hypothetical protein